jgi:hypothetical protein
MVSVASSGLDAGGARSTTYSNPKIKSLKTRGKSL